jgi:hypothetical protein
MEVVHYSITRFALSEFFPAIHIDPIFGSKNFVASRAGLSDPKVSWLSKWLCFPTLPPVWLRLYSLIRE